MTRRLTIVLAGAAALAACRGTGTEANNSQGLAALTANNSAYRGGAAPPSVGNAPIDAGSGVTGGNGQNAVSAKGYNNGGRPKSGGETAGDATGPGAPGSR
jgi:hypothetical protein